MAASGVTVVKDLWPKIRANLSLAKKSYVAVGYPGNKDKMHPESGMTMVQLAALLHYGKPRDSSGPAIPARPFIDALFIKHKAEYQAWAKAALQDIAEGKMSTKISLTRIGTTASGQLKDLFAVPGNMAYSAGQAGGWKMANSGMTIKLKGSDTPLIDGGHLKNAITFDVRMRSGSSKHAWDAGAATRRGTK